MSLANSHAKSCLIDLVANIQATEDELRSFEYEIQHDTRFKELVIMTVASYYHMRHPGRARNLELAGANVLSVRLRGIFPAQGNASAASTQGRGAGRESRRHQVEAYRNMAARTPTPTSEAVRVPGRRSSKTIIS